MGNTPAIQRSPNTLCEVQSYLELLIIPKNKAEPIIHSLHVMKMHMIWISAFLNAHTGEW